MTLALMSQVKAFNTYKSLCYAVHLARQLKLDTLPLFFCYELLSFCN